MDDHRVDLKRARRIADEFQPIVHYEELLRLRVENPERWARIGTSTQIAVGLYESQKRTAEGVAKERAA